MKTKTKRETLKEKTFSIWKTLWVFGSIKLEGCMKK